MAGFGIDAGTQHNGQVVLQQCVQLFTQIRYASAHHVSCACLTATLSMLIRLCCSLVRTTSYHWKAPAERSVGSSTFLELCPTTIRRHFSPHWE